MMSGWDLKGCEEQTGRLGLMECLPKPIDFSRLGVLIHEVLNDEKQGQLMQGVARQAPHHHGRFNHTGLTIARYRWSEANLS